MARDFKTQRKRYSVKRTYYVLLTECLNDDPVESTNNNAKKWSPTQAGLRTGSEWSDLSSLRTLYRKWNQENNKRNQIQHLSFTFLKSKKNYGFINFGDMIILKLILWTNVIFWIILVNKCNFSMIFSCLSKNIIVQTEYIYIYIYQHQFGFENDWSRSDPTFQLLHLTTDS